MEEKAYVTYFVTISVGNSREPVRNGALECLLFFIDLSPCLKNGSQAKSGNILAKFFIFLLKLHTNKIIVLILVCVLPKFMGSYSFTLYNS